jgi:hypothetical protein
VKDLQQPISSKIIHKRRNSQDLLEQTNAQRQFINSNQKQQEKDLSMERNLRKKNEDDNGGIYHRQRRTNIDERYGSGRSTSTTGKLQDNNNINRKQVEPVHLYRSNGIDEEQRMQRSKPTGLVRRNKAQNDKSPR